jgi:O-antigen/teichoic acid export membrane protein
MSFTSALAIRRLRTILKLGSTVFGLSAIFLLVDPKTFLELLNLETTEALQWSMRMIAITLIALTGNMLSVARFGSETSVVFSARIMVISAAALGALTLLIPAEFGWFTIAYAAVGFLFSLAYLSAFLRK